MLILSRSNFPSLAASDTVTFIAAAVSLAFGSTDVPAIVERALALLSNHAGRQGLSQRLAQLIDPITQPGASTRVAQMIRDMLTTTESAVG